VFEVDPWDSRLGIAGLRTRCGSLTKEEVERMLEARPGGIARTEGIVLESSALRPEPDSEA
jgi:hypothetical protein